MTIAEYFATPEQLIPQELIYGVMRGGRAVCEPSARGVALATALQAHAEQTHAGEVFVAPIDVVLDRDQALVLQPDLLFVSASRGDISHGPHSWRAGSGHRGALRVRESANLTNAWAGLPGMGFGKSGCTTSTNRSSMFWPARAARSARV